MRRVATFALSVSLSLLLGCGGPFYFPKSYAPVKKGYPNLSKVEIVSRSAVQDGQKPVLRGSVADLDGEPFIGAIVLVQSSDTMEKVRTGTDINGDFRVGLPSSNQLYSIQVEADGFHTAVLKDVPCSSGETITFKVTLSMSREPILMGDGEPMINFRSTSD